MNFTLVRDTDNYLAIVSFLHIAIAALTQSRLFSIRSAIFYVDVEYRQVDQLIEIMNCIGNLPTTLIQLESDTKATPIKSLGQDNLNIILLPNSSRFHLLVKPFKRLTQRTDHHMVILMDHISGSEQVVDRAIRDLYFLPKFVLLQSNGDMALIQYVPTPDSHRFNINLLSRESVHAALGQISQFAVKHLPRWKATVQLEMRIPYSSFYVGELGPGMKLDVIGSDPMVAYDITRRLNARAIICSDAWEASRRFIRFMTQQATNPKSAVRNRFFHPRIMSKLTDFDYNCKQSTGDIYLASSMVRFTSKQITYDTDYCYPHGSDCLSILVPIARKHDSAMPLLHQPVIWAVGIIFALMCALRVALGLEDCQQAVLITVAALFSQSFRRKPANLAEIIWIPAMLLLSISSSIFLSTTLYKSLVHTNAPTEIDTLEQLQESGLTIYVPSPDNPDTWTFDSKELDSKMVYVNESIQNTAILFERNTSNAYVLRRSKGQFWITLTSANGAIFRMMPIALYCGHLAYRIPSNSPFRNWIDDLIQSIIERGLYEAYTNWTWIHLRSIYNPNQPNDDLNGVIPLTMRFMAGAFYALLVGYILGALTCIFELLYYNMNGSVI